jgi:hypothetical protein
MRTGLWEDAPLYGHLDALIEQVQDYLDWVEDL